MEREWTASTLWLAYSAAQRHFFLHDLDYVDGVTGVSMLQISPLGDLSDLRFNLKRQHKLPRHEKDLNPSYPWSIAVPLTEHWIVISDQFEQKIQKH